MALLNAGFHDFSTGSSELPKLGNWQAGGDTAEGLKIYTDASNGRKIVFDPTSGGFRDWNLYQQFGAGDIPRNTNIAQVLNSPPTQSGQLQQLMGTGGGVFANPTNDPYKGLQPMPQGAPQSTQQLSQSPAWLQPMTGGLLSGGTNPAASQFRFPGPPIPLDQPNSSAGQAPQWGPATADPDTAFQPQQQQQQKPGLLAPQMNNFFKSYWGK